MKNKLIYLISVLLVTVVSFSCSDDDDENNDKDLIGTWNYSGKAADIHFVWGIERSGFFNDREKWVKSFENQRV